MEENGNVNGTENYNLYAENVDNVNDNGKYISILLKGEKCDRD